MYSICLHIGNLDILFTWHRNDRGSFCFVFNHDCMTDYEERENSTSNEKHAAPPRNQRMQKNYYLATNISRYLLKMQQHISFGVMHEEIGLEVIVQR